MSIPVSKSVIKADIAEGDLGKALASALQYAEYCQAAEMANELGVLSGQLQQHRSTWATGQIAYEDFSREQARIAMALLNCLAQLPEQPAPNAGKRKMTDEARFKKHLFVLLVVSKLVVLCWVWNHWHMGTFNEERASLVFALLCPVFFSCLALMLGDYLRAHRDTHTHHRRYVSGPLVAISYLLFPVYTLLSLYVLNAGMVSHEISSFATMYALLAFFETAFGGWVGNIVATFFRKEG